MGGLYGALARWWGGDARDEPAAGAEAAASGGAAGPGVGAAGSLAVLPVDFAYELLTLLDAKALSAVTCTCRTLRSIGSQDAVWRRVFVQRFGDASAHERPGRWRARFQDTRDALAANAAFYKAFSRGDARAMRQLWASGAHVRCVHPGGGLLQGQEVHTSWSQILGHGGTREIQMDNATAQVCGCTAWVTGEEVLDGNAQHRLLATNVFERAEDGRWLMVHHHASPALVP